MKNKIILSSILTIALCLSMIAGSTFALFTSESKVDVSVSSATVSVTATPTAPVMGSTLGTALGTATANGNSLTLENFVPGDYATFTINVVNDSTVAVKYRTVISVSDDNGLVSGLVVTIGADVYTGTTGNGELASTDWTLINPTEGNTSVDVKIALPEEAGNAYQGKTCTITYLVEAVQGNYVQATRVDSAEALVGALAAAQPGEIIDATGVTVAPTGSLDTTVSIPAGVTVKGATFASSSQCYLVVDGTGDDAKFEECDFEGPGFGMFVIAGNEQDGANMVFENCVFEGQVAPNFVNNSAGVATFNNCLFTVGSDNIGLVNCMGGTHIFNNCTFDYTGGSTFGSNQYVKWNAVNSYSESFSTSVTLNGCTRINCGTQKFGGNSTLIIN